jgi:hypothetical protein
MNNLGLDIYHLVCQTPYSSKVTTPNKTIYNTGNRQNASKKNHKRHI